MQKASIINENTSVMKQAAARSNDVLTKADLKKIRKLLPYGWRKVLKENHDRLEVRQISEAFYLNTRNPEVNSVVWGSISSFMENIGQNKLAEKAKARVIFCNEWNNVVPKKSV